MQSDDFIKWIKDIERRLQTLESSTGIKNITIPNEGTFIFPKYASDPASGTQGQVYFNTATNKLKVYDGSSWINLH